MSLNAKLAPSTKMPLWLDLGKFLSEELRDYSSSSTLDAISAYQHEYGRAKLIERLGELLLIKESEPGEAHRAFCSIPFDIVCTTNFDFLLERQYDAIPRYVYPVIDEEQLSISGYTAGTQLLKLHGDLRHPSRLVVTEEDYDSFLSRYPLLATYLANLLITNTAVFIGYSLDDPDFRQIWSIVSDRLGHTRRMAYTVMVDASSSDIARFGRRGVKIINLPGTKSRYSSILADAFAELREHIRNNVISVSKVTEEEPLRELSLPRDAKTRLCFFSLPLDLLSIYRSRVFPMVEEIGFVPVTADDVISPGKNISAKIDALIDRASAMVVEVTSPWTRAEFDIALARNINRTEKGNRGSLPIIIVDSEQSQISAPSEDHIVVHRNGFGDDYFESFLKELSARLSEIISSTRESMEHEASRLLAAKEYRAAVISAMSQLEIFFQKQFESYATSTASKIPLEYNLHSISKSSLNRRPIPLRLLLDYALEAKLINRADYDNIREWMTIRNRAVHEAAVVDRKTAMFIVNGVAQIVKRFNG